MTKYLEIGQIVNTFGIKGMVKIKTFTDDITRYDKLKTIYSEKKKSKKEYVIEEVKYHKDMVLMKLERNWYDRRSWTFTPKLFTRRSR